MESYDTLLSKSKAADADVAMWDRMAREAEDSAKRYRQYAKNRQREANDYRELAARKLSEFNASLKGIAA
jgi:hypothetical protein